MHELLKWGSVDQVEASTWRWAPKFIPSEFACRGTGIVAVDPEFMDKLLAVRIECNFPFAV